MGNESGVQARPETCDNIRHGTHFSCYRISNVSSNENLAHTSVSYASRVLEIPVYYTRAFYLNDESQELLVSRFNCEYSDNLETELQLSFTLLKTPHSPGGAPGRCE